MVVIAGFEVFVLCKARRTTPSRRHLFLGQMLLLGLFLCACVGGVLAATPTPATCGAVRFGAGVAFALVFAALLVKCVFLISLNGGVYLPAPYQALLLLFAVLIQVAVGLQWLLNAPPQETLPARRLVLTAEDLVPHPVCRAAYTDVLLSLLYVACLIVFVAVLAIKSRGIRDNYREATFIGLAVGCVIPIWLVWVLSGLLVADRHRDACLAFGLVATATVGRQLAAMGKEGVYVEDREERFSTLSRAGSGYSPSFYHFKPVKYSAAPLGAPAPPPPPPLAAPPPHPHKQPATAVTTIADRVALVAAPSYTRMYHYYPYCYYPGGVYVKPEDGNVYTTLEPTLSSNPNVFFQRSGVHPGMMY
ncbi:Metabotropic glutamate receptor [Gryllus bimaculatus]|nr:Metabotropic glutamate receptor [Gryllus bimaculatus]